MPNKPDAPYGSFLSYHRVCIGVEREMEEGFEEEGRGREDGPPNPPMIHFFLKEQKPLIWVTKKINYDRVLESYFPSQYLPPPFLFKPFPSPPLLTLKQTFSLV